MSTIGYGDVSPTNDYERVYVMIMCLLSCGIFGYSMSESKKRKIKKYLKKKKNKLNYFFN
jgi:hypothetical protein